MNKERELLKAELKEQGIKFSRFCRTSTLKKLLAEKGKTVEMEWTGTAAAGTAAVGTGAALTGAAAATGIGLGSGLRAGQRGDGPEHDVPRRRRRHRRLHRQAQAGLDAQIVSLRQ